MVCFIFFIAFLVGYWYVSPYLRPSFRVLVNLLWCIPRKSNPSFPPHILTIFVFVGCSFKSSFPMMYRSRFIACFAFFQFLQMIIVSSAYLTSFPYLCPYFFHSRSNVCKYILASNGDITDPWLVPNSLISRIFPYRTPAFSHWRISFCIFLSDILCCISIINLSWFTLSKNFSMSASTT